MSNRTFIESKSTATFFFFFFFLFFFFFFFFWTGLSDPIACSIVGGGIPTQNSDYKGTRLCTSKFRFFATLSLPDVLPARRLSRLIDHPSSALLHSAPLYPLSLWDSSSPPKSSLYSTSNSSSDSVSDLVGDSAARFFAPSRSNLACSHHRQDTLAPGRQVACSHRSIIGRVAIYCATVLCLRVIDFRIPSSPDSPSASARGGQSQIPSYFRCGCFPVSLLANLDWKLSMDFSILWVRTHVSDPKSSTTWATAL